MINIGWLYPDLMSTYGDRGNVITLVYRMQKRGLEAQVVKISLNESPGLISRMDMIFMGGAQDKQQEIVNKDLKANKGLFLKKAVEGGIPGLFVCGAYQFLGRYYKAADGTIIDGIGIFDLYTESPGINSQRLIGNLIVEPYILPKTRLVGFENHGGRTHLGKKVTPLAKVIKGFGNNGEDKNEGMVYKNSIGTYLHGPILPKNPDLADWIIKKTLEKKTGEKVSLKKLDDTFENKAKQVIIERYL